MCEKLKNQKSSSKKSLFTLHIPHSYLKLNVIQINFLNLYANNYNLIHIPLL